jgi:putative oxidoreductase
MESGKVTAFSRDRGGSRYATAARFLARLVLGGVFASAGALKIYDPGAFAIELERYQLVPWKIGVVAANYLPWVELLTGLCLFLKRFERGALLLVTLLLGIFTLALASALVRGLNIDCGCFGHALVSTGTVTPILRNVVLLLLAGLLWAKYR